MHIKILSNNFLSKSVAALNGLEVTGHDLVGHGGPKLCPATFGQGLLVYLRVPGQQLCHGRLWKWGNHGVSYPWNCWELMFWSHQIWSNLRVPYFQGNAEIWDAIQFGTLCVSCCWSSGSSVFWLQMLRFFILLTVSCLQLHHAPASQCVQAADGLVSQSYWSNFPQTCPWTSTSSVSIQWSPWDRQKSLLKHLKHPWDT